MEILKVRFEEALRYMGFKDKKPDEGIMKIIDAVEKDLLLACNPKYTYKIFDIKEISPDKKEVTLENCNLVLKGNDIVNHLKDCNRVVIMVCTISGSVDRLMRLYKIREMTKAVICDAMASALVEQVCDEAQREICEKIKGYTTWRFSCGYGDFPLETQKQIVMLLDTPKTIAVSVNESMLLTPQKSVSAVFGVSNDIIDKKRVGCETCNMNESCEFRKRGERCEI